MLDTSIVNLALPQLGAAFGVAPTSLGWITNAYLLPFVVMIPVVARLGDATDRARLLAAGAAIFAAASTGAALASSWYMLLAMRAAQGLGASALATMSMALVTANFQPGLERDRALGWYLSGPAFGGALGPLAGAMLTALSGWRMMFAGQVPLAILVVLLIWRVPSPARRSHRSLDPFGMLLAATALFGLSLALLQAPEWGWTSTSTLIAWGTAIVSGAGFVIHERTTADPLLALRVFSSRFFLASGLAGAATWFGIISGFMLLPLYLEGLRGFSPLHTSLLLGAWPLGALLVYPFAGKAVARVGPAAMMQLTLAATLLAALAMILYGADTPDAIIVMIGLPLGVATAVAQVATAAGAVSEFAKADAGVAAGLFNTLRQVGSIIGGALPISMLGVGKMGNFGLTYDGLQNAFTSRVAVLGVSLLCVWILLRRARRN
jgi:MFS family permease